jgi:soluble lytic murein transglycosylase
VALSRVSLFVLSLFLALYALMPSKGPRPSQPMARAEDSTVPPFDPDVVRPEPGSRLAEVLSALRAQDFLSAQRLSLLGLSEGAGESAPLLRWAGALAARELGDHAGVVSLLEPLAHSVHALSPWAKLWLAEALEAADAARALQFAEELVHADSTLEGFPARVDAERLRARLLSKLGRVDEAVAELTRLLAGQADENAPLTLMMPLADLLSVRSEPERVRALSLYRSVAARVPLTKLGRKADERADAVLQTLPSALKAELADPSLEVRLMRADALLADLRYSDAESAYDALEREAKDPRVQCRVRFGRAKALIDRRKREQGSQLMVQVADTCTGDVEQRAWARYYAGRALSTLGLNAEAIAQYEALEREAPSHRLADDALFRAAKVARDMGDAQGVESRLTALPIRYPSGDMGPRARFALAWHAYTHGERERAAEILARDAPDEDAEDLQGRAGYFRARFLHELGEGRAAVEAFARVFEHAPLAYYGHQAFARLKALDPARAHALLSTLSHRAPDKITFELRTELLSPGFERAVALLGAGDLINALAELRALGFLASDADPELTWLSVVLFDRASAPHVAVELARKRMPMLLTRAPRGRDLALYRAVYPRAFAPLIEETAQREGVPGAFVRAVAREESGFLPHAVSRANARGLIQVLEPTARTIAKGLGLPHHPEALARPEVNLAIGVHFISTIAGSLRGQYALVPVAYNAGPSVASRWLGERASEPLDVWVENIPYDETRHYTRRVVQSYGVYHFLATGELLDLPLTLPAL